LPASDSVDRDIFKVKLFQGYVRVLKLILDFSLKLNRSSNVVNSVDSTGSTALHIAVSKNNVELLRFLLTK
jgi:ankyrin repeat protein